MIRWTATRSGNFYSWTLPPQAALRALAINHGARILYDAADHEWAGVLIGQDGSTFGDISYADVMSLRVHLVIAVDQ